MVGSRSLDQVLHSLRNSKQICMIKAEEGAEEKEEEAGAKEGAAQNIDELYKFNQEKENEKRKHKNIKMFEQFSRK